MLQHACIFLELAEGHTIKQIRKEYRDRYDEEAVDPATCYAWRRHYLKKYAYIKVPPLNNKTRAARYDMCYNTSPAFWGKVLFTDEKWFFFGDGRCLEEAPGHLCT